MAVSDAHVFPGFLTPVLTQLSFQSHRLFFSHASEARGEICMKKKFASRGYRTHNHQVMRQTRSPLSQPGGLLRLTPLNQLINQIIMLHKSGNLRYVFQFILLVSI